MAANSGRKAQHPHLKLMKGKSEGHDIAGRAVPPPPDFNRGEPPKPRDLSDDASWLWDQVLDQMRSVGLLKPLDAAALEIACETFAMWREAVRQRRLVGMLSKNSQGVVRGPWIAIEGQASKEFRAWCSEFGFTPASEKNLGGESGVGSSNANGNPFAG